MDVQKSTKRNRAARTSTVQSEELVKYMETHSDFAAGKFLTKEGKVHHIQQWDELKNMLNALSTCPDKTTKQWQTVWRDMKSNTSRKASKLRRERNKTGNLPVETDQLNILEQRIIACVGLEYVQGNTDCPDSMPEEEEHQLQLEKGNENILKEPPVTVSIANMLNMNDENDNDNYVPHETSEEANEVARTDELTYSEVFNTLRNNADERPVHNFKAPRVRPGSQQTLRNRKRIGVQLHEARENFTQIAQNHAAAIQLFAEASIKQAEAALLSAQNQEKLVMLEEQRLNLEIRRTEIVEKQIEVIENFQQIISNLLEKRT